MNTLFIIGGIAVLTGITYMTIAYFQQAKELRKMTEKYEKEKEVNDVLWSALISDGSSEEVKFGDF